MIKLICYSSKTLHIKETHHSYVGEKGFTTIKVIAANEIDGHKLSDLQVDLHIKRGIYDDCIPLSLTNYMETNEAEILLEDKYTSYEGTIGFYLQFSKTSQNPERNIIGKTNAVYIDVINNIKTE